MCKTTRTFVPWEKLRSYVSEGKKKEIFVDNTLRGTERFFGLDVVTLFENSKSQEERDCDRILDIVRECTIAPDLPILVVAELKVSHYTSF